MLIQKQLKEESRTCSNGECPSGVESIKKIGLSPEEKRAIFFSLKREIFEMKKAFKDLSSI